MTQHFSRSWHFLLVIVLAGVALSGCADRLRASRGTRIPPELRGLSSSELTERFTRDAVGEHLSMVATLVDFSYVRAVSRERSRVHDQERAAYERYVRRQTTFYVYLVLHDRESCGPTRPSRSKRRENRTLSLESWTFVLKSSGGRDREVTDFEPGPTKLAPSGGCLVQGYVRFAGSIPRNAEWIELDASSGRDDDLVSSLRWDLGQWTPPRRQRGKRPPRRARPRPSEDDDREPPEADEPDDEVDDGDDEE